jgi:putative N-acetyltransferase (TIGR04045 family)
VAASSSAPSRRPDLGGASAPAAVCRVVRDAAELDAHFEVRRQVFVQAQGLFVGSDRDERDFEAATLHAVAVAGGSVAGAVRLYPLDPEGRWKGDRLAVLPAVRVNRLGAMLVSFAVATAGDLGGRVMVASIQLPNVAFFERLGWRRDGAAALLHGVLHQPMAIELALTPGR